VSQTVTAAGVVAGSLIDDGDVLGIPPATITNLNAQGIALPFGVPTPIDDTNGRLCGTITVAADGGYGFTPNLLPQAHECTVTYTLSNAAGDSSATETFQIPGP
jgi:hypothetical protein